MRWLLCHLLKIHVEFSHAQDHGFGSPPKDHPFHPSNGDPSALFGEWTRLRCRHCNWTFPK